MQEFIHLEDFLLRFLVVFNFHFFKRNNRLEVDVGGLRSLLLNVL